MISLQGLSYNFKIICFKEGEMVMEQKEEKKNRSGYIFDNILLLYKQRML